MGCLLVSPGYIGPRGAPTPPRCPTYWRKVGPMDEAEQVASRLARNLVALRHARTITQDALAKSSGVPRSTIANLESGDGNPSLTVLLKVAGALEVPLDELLAGPRAVVRRWTKTDISSQSRGTGVRLRPLVPEPAPEEMLIMEFA